MQDTSFSPKDFEEKWAKRFEARGRSFTLSSPKHQKSYILDMFPYPSGTGLHVGHVLNFVGSDVQSRYARMQGKDVFHPIGWDAFGLPAENYAIKSGIHPSISTAKNTEFFGRQLVALGCSYDWSYEINTSLPEYYKWTQWLFQLLYKRGLAYRKDGAVNWCESCQTALANEQVIAGRCERCSTLVVQKQLQQWYFKITAYAERLLKDLETLDWPEKVKAMQRNWIGRSEGVYANFLVENKQDMIRVFTTRIDTLFGVTYLVLAPEHPLVDTLTTKDQAALVKEYQVASAHKSELDRQHLDKTKSGVFTGSYATHPLTEERIPIWIADYVLTSYGTGAVMAVPAHDERDFDFAKAYNLPIIQVVKSAVKEDDVLPYLGSGTLINSGIFDGKTSSEAVEAITSAVQGEVAITYRLRDWLVSRQRFWGAPIPILYTDDGQEVLVDEELLPVLLPMNVDFKPTGKSPLATATDWRKVKQGGVTYTREVDTLDTFVCSSWYFLRYISPHLTSAPFDSDLVNQWLPVDLYIGGAEHAVLHLLYARFFTKVLYDAGYVDFEEPFTSLRNQGMVLGPDHQKMSKSRGNVVNPDTISGEYGSDVLRLFILFLGPYDQEKPWDPKGIIGIKRFTEKLWRLQYTLKDANESELRVLHKTIQKVSEDLAENRFNTAIAACMECVNACNNGVSRESLSILLKLLSPLAPFITHEMWERLGHEGEISNLPWPMVDERYLIEGVVTYAVQINGRVRAQVSVQSQLTNQEDIAKVVLQDEVVVQRLQGSKVIRVIVVPGKIVSLLTESE